MGGGSALQDCTPHTWQRGGESPPIQTMFRACLKPIFYDRLRLIVLGVLRGQLPKRFVF